MIKNVLVVGAGPTGLVLALWLARLGVKVRIVDRAAVPGTTSRAVGVQARTLELYRQLDAVGLEQPMVAHGIPSYAANLWASGVERARVEFGKFGKALSPFPYMLIFPQDAHEKLLTERLTAAGVTVERPVELVGLDGTTARLRLASGEVETATFDYVAGCDGARSYVRQSLGIDFPGGTYSHMFYVADVEATGPTMNGELHIAIDDDDFLACFPLEGRTRARLIGAIKKDTGELVWSDVNGRSLERMHLTVTKVNWFSTYHVHHRIASAFRAGNVFLLGDAAHIHSPAGGQGMNTGIGDAVNLAWKLSEVIHRRAGASLLDTYVTERVPFAQKLVRTTDRAFEIATADSAFGRFARLHVAPAVLSTLFHTSAVRRFAFNTLSQTKIEYRQSAISAGRVGRLHGGDRLPWVAELDNFAVLSSLDWQAHVYGAATEALRKSCAERGLRLHVFEWKESAANVGLTRDTVYIVRPDGYIGLVSKTPDLATYFARLA